MCGGKGGRQVVCVCGEGGEVGGSGMYTCVGGGGGGRGR